jgi:hypothetical protein
MRFMDSAIEVCLTLKAVFGLALRQVTGLVASLLKLAKLDWTVPDYTTLCRRQKTLTVSLDSRASAGGLHLLVDSTGMKIMGEGEWETRKHGTSYRRQWRKVYLGIDAETLEIQRSRSPPTRLMTRRCCRICWHRSPRTSASRSSTVTTPMTPGFAVRQWRVAQTVKVLMINWNPKGGVGCRIIRKKPGLTPCTS